MTKPKIAETATIYTIGSLGYCLIEIFWRGYTHWSMTITGGLCFLLLYEMNTLAPRRPFLSRCLAGAVLVTAVEFAVGCLVNLILGWAIWDYSQMPGQVLGQICLPFFILWFLLCIPVSTMARVLGGIFGRKNCSH